jgi:hypothetical protein
MNPNINYTIKNAIGTHVKFINIGWGFEKDISCRVLRNLVKLQRSTHYMHNDWMHILPE